MSERNGFEHGVPCWVAGVHPDPAEAASFYGDLLGWEPEEMEPGRLVCRGGAVLRDVNLFRAPEP